jgi:hypothetical protein
MKKGRFLMRQHEEAASIPGLRQKYYYNWRITKNEQK